MSRHRYLAAVYAHLGVALAALVAFDTALFGTGAAAAIDAALRSVPWGLVLGAFMVVGWLASRAAWRLRSPVAQYAALGAYVVAKGLILVPLLYRAEATAPGAIPTAAVATLAGVAGLTAIVLATGSDFSFLRGALWWGGLVALALIVVALTTPVRLGAWFSVGMVALAGAGILYDTSKLLRRRERRRIPAAALSLFASVAMMFWYVLRLVGRGGWSRG